MTKKRLLSLEFLKGNLRVLRESKGKSFAASFLEQLENTAFELSEAMNQRDKFSMAVAGGMPSSISKGFIDSCFDAIEREINSLCLLQPGQEETSNPEELAKIAYDLFCLAVYIRFTLDPVAASAQRDVFVDKGFVKKITDIDKTKLN